MRAATYVRSSKDRHDVSLDAQRRELQQLAVARGFDLVAEFADAVESGKTDDRPGFQALLDALKNNSRGWSALLVYDTSRLARRRYIAQALKHEARKRGVVIHYAKLPQDLDPIAEVVLESVFEAMDEVHSLMSKEKGMAGLLVTPDGQPWRVQGDRYRLRPGRLVAASKVEGAVLTRLRADLSTLGFWQSLIDAARRQRRDAPDASQEIARLERERARAASLAAATEDPAPFLVIVQERTRSIDALRREAEARRKEAGIDDLVARTTPAELAEMALAAPAKAVAALVDRVVLAPDLASCTIEYRAPGWRPVASPRGFARSPLLAVRVNLR